MASLAIQAYFYNKDVCLEYLREREREKNAHLPTHFSNCGSRNKPTTITKHGLMTEAWPNDRSHALFIICPLFGFSLEQPDYKYFHSFLDFLIITTINYFFYIFV